MTHEINGSVAAGDLFVFYGLLKKGASGMPDHIDLEAAGEFLGPCRFRAALYDVGFFPGAVQGSDLCHGVRYRIADVSIVPALDAFEDVVPDDPARSMYLRRRIELLDDDGRATDERAWIYWYNQSIDGRPYIDGGDWPLSAGRPRW